MDGQTIKEFDNRTEYRFDGVLHREDDLPAIDFFNGTKKYFIHGLLSRGGGEPAIIYNYGRMEYYLNGVKHRDGDLPTTIFPNGTQKYSLNGMVGREGDKPAIVRGDGTLEYFKNGKRGRDNDMPAIVRVKGTLEYWQDDKRHREGDRPAVIHPNGTVEHWFHGECHRDGGKPAIIHYTGRVEHWVNGICLCDSNKSHSLDERETRINNGRGHHFNDGRYVKVGKNGKHRFYKKKRETIKESDPHDINGFYDRLGTISAEEVLSFISSNQGNCEEIINEYFGQKIKLNSIRYRIFIKEGYSCVRCSKKGVYFAVEKSKAHNTYGLNLYAIDDDEKEILMTVDHIIPASKGGTKSLKNLQPMCQLCNYKKGNS